MSYRSKPLPEKLAAELDASLRQAAQYPARRSEILGNTAMGLAAAAQRPEHLHHAPLMHAMAEQIAEASLAAQGHGPATLDDFEELLHEVDAAHEQFSGDLDVLARADDIHDQTTTHRGGGQRMSIAPLTWGKGATLGRTGRFKYNPSSDDVANNISQAGTLAYWVGEPHESQAVTIDLAVPADFLPPPLLALAHTAPVDTSTRARGIVSYGADGAITKVPFDVGFGARFTVTGNYVAVQIAMDPPMAGADPGTMSYTCSMGAFASPSLAPLFYTTYIDQLDSGASTPPIQRPPHATQILPILSDATGGNATLSFYGQGGKTLLTQFSYPIGQLWNPLPLPSEVQYIVLENSLGTGGPANFRIPFQLSL